MKKISDIQIFNNSQKVQQLTNISKENKNGFMTYELTEKMLNKMKKNIKYFLYEIKNNEEEFNSIVKDWYRYIKEYRQQDCYEVFDMFMTKDDITVELRTFISNLRSVASRNAIAREQNKRANLALNQELQKSSREKAKKYLDMIRKDLDIKKYDVDYCV